MKELMEEVFISMKNNKMRIALTGFSVGWGMFILVILLGSAGGFQRGIRTTFYFDRPQAITVTTGNTSVAFGGFQQGHAILLTMDDAMSLANAMPGKIARTYPTVTQNTRIGNGMRYAQVSLTGCEPGYMDLVYSQIVKGRDLNVADTEEKRKNCVLTERLARQLFNDDNPIAQTVHIGEIPFQVVGVCKSRLEDDTSLGAYAAISTLMSLYRVEGNVDAIALQVKELDSEEANISVMDEVRNTLAKRKGCSPKDNHAIRIDNSYESILQVQGVLGGIGVFVWVIGIATLFAGIVGVSNIMLITVKERTRELGVRKAMGASNSSIIRLVLLESVIITMMFCYIGLMVGIGLTQLLNIVLGDIFPMFRNPTVQFLPVVVCNLIMVVAGLVAGYIPARRAVRIKLVEALMS